MTPAGGRRRRRQPALAPVLVALTVALAAAGCASTADTPSGLRAWASSASLASTARLLRGDVHDIATGIRLGRLKATKTACDGLGYDASGAIGALPAPDKTLTRELNDAYSTLVNAGQDCSSAPSFAAEGFARYRAGAAQAIAGLAAAERRLRRLEGR